VGKYHEMYEQKMNPFEEVGLVTPLTCSILSLILMQFSLHERQRKLQELSVADRIILNTVMAIVSSSWGRRLVDRIIPIFDFEFLTLRGVFICSSGQLLNDISRLHALHGILDIVLCCSPRAAWLRSRIGSRSYLRPS
jgi:hypothetical protein